MCGEWYLGKLRELVGGTTAFHRDKVLFSSIFPWFIRHAVLKQTLRAMPIYNSTHK